MNEQLDKYFLGELSDTEKKELLDQIESDSGHKAEFIRMQNTITISKLGEQKGDNEWASQKMEELGNRINRRQIRKLYLNLAKYAAVVAILFINIWLLADKFMPEEKAVLYTKIEVPKGQRIYMTFQDGTEAWLSPRSVIKIPNEFSNEERTVELDGEGFFSVTKDAERPFIVKTNGFDVKVLGTQFNVCAYKEDAFASVVLVDGRVEVNSGKNNKSELSPNQMFEINDKGTAIKEVDVFEYICWKDNMMMLSDRKVGETLDRLSRYYGRTIWYNEEIGDIPISGKLDLRENMEDVINIICQSLFLQYKTDANNNVIISK